MTKTLASSARFTVESRQIRIEGRKTDSELVNHIQPVLSAARHSHNNSCGLLRRLSYFAHTMIIVD